MAIHDHLVISCSYVRIWQETLCLNLLRIHICSYMKFILYVCSSNIYLSHWLFKAMVTVTDLVCIVSIYVASYTYIPLHAWEDQRNHRHTIQIWCISEKRDTNRMYPSNRYAYNYNANTLAQTNYIISM